MRPAAALILCAASASAEIRPIWSLDSGQYYVECAAIFSLLTPVQADPVLTEQFEAARADLMGRVTATHGDRLAQTGFDAAVIDWTARRDSVQGRLDLSERLRICTRLTPAVTLE